MKPFFSLFLLALVAGAAPGGRLVLSDCDDPSSWTGGTRDTAHVKQGAAAIGWAHGKSAQLLLKNPPSDWSTYDHLSFWLWSEKATGSRFMVLMGSQRPGDREMAYYSESVKLDFTGWKRIRIYLPAANVSRNVAGWNKITYLHFSATGWGNTLDPSAITAIDDLVLTAEGAPQGPAMTDDDLFAELELSRLPSVASALKNGGTAAAKHALAEFYRRREKPLYYIKLGEKAEPKPSRPDVSRAERAMRHEFESIGYPHTFGPKIDWHFDKTAEAGTKYAPNNEWTWQLNRHPEWLALSRAYRDTHNEKYAKEFVEQMTAWVRDCPMPATSGNVPRSAWRTIETGIRASAIWPELWYRFVAAPSMTDDALIAFLKAYIDHAHHLMAYHTTGNWLAMEGNGLFHVGVLFPEFKAAKQWRDTAVGWIYPELNAQVYPDGVQIELASGYHHVSLGNFLELFKIARLNETPLPADFLKRLEKMYDFDVYGAMPDRKLPGVQDGGYFDVRRALAEAASLFPSRQDFRWYASNGKEGRPPSETSHAFPYAGYYVMRSGWDPDARWLWFDGGPFGYGHQHEDKLEIIVSAYGKTFLADPGNFTYERSKWRSYFTDSPSHNIVMVDGQPQRRRGQPRESYVVKDPLPHVWASTPESDYVEATFDENFGGDVKRGVSHTRAVLFVKPDFWVILDTLTAKDGRLHSYDALFHFDAKVKAEGVRLVSAEDGEPSLTIAARPDPGLSLKIIEGQEEPVQGWLVGRNISSVRPAPVGVYNLRGATSHMLYVLAPAPKGAKDPVKKVERIEGDPLSARIVFVDGRSYDVRFRLGQPATVTAKK